MSTVYDIITSKIIEKLEQGVCPWRQPWSGVGPQNLFTGHSYKGINLFLTFGHEKPYFATFKQITEAGLKLKKGSKSLPIVFWMKHEKKDASGDIESSFMSPRFYKVFNVADIESNIKLDAILETKEQKKDHKPISEAQTIVDSFKDAPSITFEGSRAYYRPSLDSVVMPEIGYFKSPELFYSVLFHELAHSTGHKTRLERQGVIEAQAFGSDTYGKEELIAEMTAAFLCGDCGLDNSTLETNAAYLNSWIKTIKGDPKMLMSAASHATKAAKWIKNERE